MFVLLKCLIFALLDDSLYHSFALGTIFSFRSCSAFVWIPWEADIKMRSGCKRFVEGRAGEEEREGAGGRGGCALWGRGGDREGGHGGWGSRVLNCLRKFQPGWWRCSKVTPQSSPETRRVGTLSQRRGSAVGSVASAGTW